MSENEHRARWLANWAEMTMEAADYLRDRGQESDGENIERAVFKVLDLAGEEIGAAVINRALQDIHDRWGDGKNLVNDYFADDGLSTVRLLH